MRSSRSGKRVSSEHKLDTKLIMTDEERQENSQKRRRVEEQRRQDDTADAAANGAPPSTSSTGGTMQLNGVDYVPVDPSATARGGALHPSLPTRPAFDIIPKGDTAVNDKPAKKMTASQREAESLKAGPDAIPAMQGSNADWVKNRKATRMANLSAAQMLKVELEGEGGGEEDGEDEDDPVTIEKTEDEEKEETAPDFAKAVLEQQAEDEGLDEEVIQPAVRTDEDEGEAAVPLNGEETMEHDQGEDGEVEESLPAAPKRKRGSKRKAADLDGEESVENSDEEEPPHPEADQPVPKKLKFNPDGTVEGYIDDVRYVQCVSEEIIVLTEPQTMGAWISRTVLPAEVWRRAI